MVIGAYLGLSSCRRRPLKVGGWVLPRLPLRLSLAQIAGIISNVPGGLGVFETVLMLLLAPAVEADGLLGSLLVYRVIYYLTPLLMGVVLLGGYELYQRRHHLPSGDSARST